MSQQNLKQASIRAVTGTTLSYSGDWHALFDLGGIAAGDFNSRMLAWINVELSSSYTSLNSAQNAYAVANGVDDWDALGTWTPGGGGQPETPGQGDFSDSDNSGLMVVLLEDI